MNNKTSGTETVFSDISKMLSKSIHDINNPLSVILGQLSILELLLKKDEIDLERIQKSIDKMKSGSEKMLGRMKNLRDYYKVAMGDHNYTSWNSIATSLVYLFSPVEAFKIEINVPEEEFTLPLQETFILLYHIVHKSAENELIKIDITQEKGEIHILSSGRIMALPANEQNSFECVLENLSAKTVEDATSLRLTIPLTA